jgi:hypothetical protein
MVFGTCLIETCVVNTHLKLPIGLRDDHRVGQPLKVVDLPYEVLLLNGQLPRLLLDRSGVGVNLQMVLDHLPRDHRHL